MAKRRASNAAPPVAGENRAGYLNNTFEAMRAQGQHVLGSDVSLGTDRDSDMVGLPLPALALRYMFATTIFPLGRITQIVGEEGCGKSRLADEIGRWHMQHGGGVVLAENENKDSPDMRYALWRWNQDWMARLLSKPTYALEEWQDVFTTYLKLWREHMDAPDGPGRTIPVVFVVDSVMATAPYSEIEQVMKEGHAARGYALAAQLISRYMRAIPSMIRGYPFSVIGTNHMKPGMDPQGRPTVSVPGGKSLKFMETFEIEIRKAASGYDIDKLEYSGLRLRLTAKKNGAGPSRREIIAEVLWWFEPGPDGRPLQQAAWDWDTASIEMIQRFEVLQGKKTIYNRLRDITGITIVDKGKKLAYSPKLGYPSSDPVEYRILGAELEKPQYADMMTEIHDVLGIIPRHEFRPGTDYRDAVAAAEREAKARAALVPEQISELPTLDLDGHVVDADNEWSGDAEGVSDD